MPGKTIKTQCCIAGGGPAGMMLGFMLARAGVDVVVLEKHIDFLRDFRGDTVHPSTLQVMDELGILDEFLKRPHQKASQITGYIEGQAIPVADFTHLSPRHNFVALMPQWDFLNFISQQAKRHPKFHLMMQAEVTGLLRDGDRIAGVTGKMPEGELAVDADLTIGADGRHSIVRRLAGLEVEAQGVPIDVLWMRLPRRPEDPSQPLGRVVRGRIFVMLDRGDYWQCALVVAKGSFEDIRRAGLDPFRAEIIRCAPFTRDRVDEIRSWDDVKLLTVMVDRLKKWCKPGLLCIGDSAHAMSPIGGVGINLAIQDAVAAANLLAGPLAKGKVTVADLAKVQQRRELPTRLTQAAQVFIQDRVLSRVLASKAPLTVPWPIKLLKWVPALRRLPALAIGVGFRPEHVTTRAANR